jgi:hypothetical protein
VVLPMDMLCSTTSKTFYTQILMGLNNALRYIETLIGIKKYIQNIQETMTKWKGSYILSTIYPYTTKEYNQKSYAWYDFEANCDDCYMDSCHFLDDNYFYLIFD